MLSPLNDKFLHCDHRKFDCVNCSIYDDTIRTPQIDQLEHGLKKHFIFCQYHCEIRMKRDKQTLFGEKYVNSYLDKNEKIIVASYLRY